MTHNAPPVSSTASPMPAAAPHAPLRLGAVACVAVLPAAGAAYAASETLRIFDAMTRYEGEYGNGHGGIATVAAVFAHVNAALLAALVLGLASTLYLRFAQQRGPNPETAIPATPLSVLAACLAGVPAAIVYFAESGALALLAPGAAAGTVMEATERLTTLLRAAVVTGLAIALLGVLAAAMARRQRRWMPSSGAPWMLAGALLLGLSVAFAVRSFALHDAVAAAVAR